MIYPTKARAAQPLEPTECVAATGEAAHRQKLQFSQQRLVGVKEGQTEKKKSRVKKSTNEKKMPVNKKEEKKNDETKIQVCPGDSPATKVQRVEAAARLW